MLFFVDGVLDGFLERANTRERRVPRLHGAVYLRFSCRAETTRFFRGGAFAHGSFSRLFQSLGRRVGFILKAHTLVLKCHNLFRRGAFELTATIFLAFYFTQTRVRHSKLLRQAFSLSVDVANY